MKASPPDPSKLAANMQADHKMAQDLFAGMMAEPAAMIELAAAFARNANPLFWLELQQQALNGHAKLLAGFVGAPGSPGKDERTPPSGDRRFSAPEWNQNAWFQWLRDAYLLNSKLEMEAIENAELEPGLREKLAFYARLRIEAFSPANFRPSALARSGGSVRAAIGSSVVGTRSVAMKSSTSLPNAAAPNLGIIVNM